MLRLAATVLLATALTQGVAVAQNNSSATSGDTNTTTSAQNAQSIPQELKKQLRDEGFSNVEIVPGSFLVSAKDKDGNPVQMVVGPHSITMLTMEKSGPSSTTGSGTEEYNKNGSSDSDLSK